MAEGEFWLPSDFLSDDFSDDKTAASLSSPLDSESDEDDTLAGLTRQMADSFLNPHQTADHYPNIMASSPQSTLCPGGIWSGSSNGSPTGASQFSSPPETPLEQRKGDLAWDFPLPPAAPGFYSSPTITHKSQQAERFYHLQQQQLIKQQLSATWGRHQQNSATWGRHQQNRAKSGGAPLGLPSSAWPPLGKQQQQHHHHPQPPQSRSGFRAVFLTGSGQRESAGTGVFLPRRSGTPAELRKKPSCSTVLLPDRVIQALNLKLEDIGHHHPRFAVDHDGMMARGKQFPAQQQKQGYYRVAPSTAAAGGGNVEVSLPAEWTY